MRVGLSLAFNNPDEVVDDAVLWRDELSLVDLAEPLGFDSLWLAEHHFTDYCVMPDSLQFLAYAAARTTRLGLGTMVVVLPWHDPVRVTEQVIALDVLSGGRTILGIGRGIAEVEFEGLRVPMSESRERFAEAAEIVLTGLETGKLHYDGKYYQQPLRELRPRPAGSFRGRAYSAAISPESIETVARFGLGLLMTAQKPWDATTADIQAYRRAYERLQGAAAPAPSAHVVTFCDEDGDRAREVGRGYITAWYRSAIAHYNLAGPQFAGVAGYEYYAKMTEHQNQYGAAASDFMVDLQVCGTPAECLDQIRFVQAAIGCDTYVATLSYGGMPGAESQRNVRCFAEHVLPALKGIGPAGPHR